MMPDLLTLLPSLATKSIRVMFSVSYSVSFRATTSVPE